MELMMILTTIILIVTLIRISSSLTAIRGAFERLEIMLAKLAADTAATPVAAAPAMNPLLLISTLFLPFNGASISSP